jgi:DNA repair protein RecN (Recombination protein N)
MLSHLQIRDFAIVEHLELELRSGMTAMTGETGAGKSIMVDAIGLLLGDRADTTAVRAGAGRAEISAMFDLEGLPEARNWLESHDLDSGTDCHLRRVINIDGRSRAYVNNTPQTLQALKHLGELLVDIHGQHAHQSLIKRDSQRQLLDDYAGNAALLQEVNSHFQTWSRLQKQLTELSRSDAERDARLDFLRFQLAELEALELEPSEPARLEEEHLRLANAGRLLDACQRASQSLYEDDELSAHRLLSRTGQELESLTGLDSRLGAISELVNGAMIQVQEAGDALRRYARDVELDPGRLDWVEQRLAGIHDLARKHRCPSEELPALLERLRREADTLDNAAPRREQLQRELDQALSDYNHCAENLSRRRSAAAAELSERVSEAMQELGMPDGRFEARLATHQQPALHGLETVELMVSANPGQPNRPLSKVASGGELSRISLAIQVIAARGARIPTLIFDEVDTGIGGGIAEVVGRQLRVLGDSHQVLCVTHLPQVAAQAHHHLQIRKHTDGVSTQTRVGSLNHDARVQEIARMLGGLQLTDNTLAHAREMIENAARN